MFEGRLSEWTLSLLLFFMFAFASAELQEVFEPGFTSLHRIYDLQLEDLAFKTKPRPQSMLRNLFLSISAPPHSIKPKLFYQKAVRNLKSAAPNLETIELNGGYVFNPNNTKNVKNSSNYEQMLLDKFGESSIIDDSDNDGVEMLIDLNGIEFRVNFAFITDTLIVKKVFPDGVHRLANVRQIHLEDFCNECGYPGEQHDLVQLMLGLGVPPPSNTASVYVFYLSSMQNLKSTLPNLKRLRLAGGYINLAEQDSFDRKEFATELKKRFNYEVTDDEIASKDFDFVATIETVRCHIFLSLNEPVAGAMDQLPMGRMKSIYIFLFFTSFIVCALSSDDVFEANDEILKKSGKANIEQFFSTGKLSKKYENEDDLDLSAFLYTPENVTDIQEFYSTAVENLKKVAPKLRTINLYGGHVLKPEKSSVKAVHDEIVYSKEHLQALMSALKKQGIKVTSNVFNVLFVVDDKTQKESKIEKFIGEQLEKDSVIDDSNEDGLELLFKIDDTEVHLYLVFINNLEAVEETKLPVGRTSYAKAISDYLEPIYDKLEEKSKGRIHKDESKLFTPGVKRINRAGEIHLEEFYDNKFNDSSIKDTSASDSLKQLVLSVGFPELNDKKPEEFYKQAVQHLKEKAPKLKRVRLDGGYAYNPSKHQEDEIKNEINFLKENIGAILSAFNAAEVNDAEESGYPKLIKEAFGYEPNEKDIDTGRVLMSFVRDETDCDVELNFFDEPPKSLSQGRTPYYVAAKAYDEEQEKSEKKED
ncbi:hypothetical protein M3Y98_01179300 [Aphelenchoides besseyi]|nr:hypothetical protein M3Y98_01179300 [Aphelenchoides besseyi]KAI6211052.1 hypothetical protein M3Y96_00392400 [Aphelenchoides besseyi]